MTAKHFLRRSLLTTVGLAACLPGRGATPPTLALKPQASVAGAYSLDWVGAPGTEYDVEFTHDLAGGTWTRLHQGLVSPGPVAFSLPLQGSRPRAYYRVAARDLNWNPAELPQPLDSYSWNHKAVAGETQGYRPHGHLAADMGEFGGGLHLYSSAIANGENHLIATSGASGTTYVGHWYSLLHLARETGLEHVLNLAAPLAPEIPPGLQMPVRAVEVRVTGSGRIKIELKTAANSIRYQSSQSVYSPLAPVVLRYTPPANSALGDIKFCNLVVESPSDVRVDEIRLVHALPQWMLQHPLHYAFLTTHGSLLRALDRSTGATRDRGIWSAGAFDSTPAAGFQALAAAMAADLGYLDAATARQIARQSVAWLAAAPRWNGLLAHWVEAGRPRDYSTVDSALALLSAWIACHMLDLAAERTAIAARVDDIQWTPLVDADGRVSHGYLDDGSPNPYRWVHFGSESVVVQILRLLQDPGAPLFAMDSRPPVFGGRGFIMEMGSLLIPHLGSLGVADHTGLNWRGARLAHLDAQRAYFPARYPNHFFSLRGFHGLSVGEIINEHASLTYLEGGVGDGILNAQDGGGWIFPHYMAMAGDLAPADTRLQFERLVAQGLIGPLSGLPESILDSAGGTAPARVHPGYVALNQFFAIAGLYKAICASDGRENRVHQACFVEPRLKAVMSRLFPWAGPAGGSVSR